MDSLILITFDTEAKAYQGLSELKQLDSTGAVDLHEAAVVIRGADGGLAVRDSVGFDRATGASTGSIVGMLIGLLAGPVGLLLGWLTGGLVGASTDVVRAAEATSGLTFVSRALPPGSTALIAAVSEPTADAVDAFVRRLGGQVTRQPAEAVHAALVSATRAQIAAEEAARKTMREEHAAERHSKWEDITASLKRTFGSSKGAGG